MHLSIPDVTQEGGGRRSFQQRSSWRSALGHLARCEEEEEAGGAPGTSQGGEEVKLESFLIIQRTQVALDLYVVLGQAPISIICPAWTIARSRLPLCLAIGDDDDVVHASLRMQAQSAPLAFFCRPLSMTVAAVNDHSRVGFRG